MGTPLATAFVRIRPDSKGFRREAEQQLKGDLDKVGKSSGSRLGAALAKALASTLEGAGSGIGKRVGDEFAKGFNERAKEKTKDAPVGPSAPRTRKQGEESGGSYADGFKRQLQQAARSLPPLTVGVASTRAEQQLRDLTAQLQELGGKTIGVDLDAGAAVAQVRALEAQLKELAATSPDIQVKADTKAALARLAGLTGEAQKEGRRSAGAFADSFRRQLEQAAAELPHIEVDASTGPAQRQLAGLTAQIQALAGQRIGIDIDAGVAVERVRGLQEQLGRLARTSPSVQVRVDAGAAQAKLALISQQADRSGRSVSSLGSMITGALGRAFEGVSGLASTFFQSLSENAVKGGGQITTSMVTAAASTTAMTAATGGLNLVIGAAVAVFLAQVAATVGLTAAFLALAPVMATIGGLLGATSTLLLGVGAGAAVLIMGLGGIGGALEAMDAANDDAADSSKKLASAQNAIASASDQVKSALASQQNARASVAEAARRASQQIEDAERSLGQARKEAARQAQDAQLRVVEAQQRARDAQRTLSEAERDALSIRKELTRAQSEARENLEDLASAVKSSALDQRQAVLDVAEAQKELQRVRSDPKATALERQQAQLAYERQLQQQADLRTRSKRLQAEQAEAAKKGIAGSDQVVAARKRIADADRGVESARRGVKDAEAAVKKAEQEREDSRVAGQQKVDAAERALSEARRAREAQQRQGAFQLAQAAQSVTSAQRALAQASQQAGTSGSAAMQKLNKEMAKLSPQGQKLVRTLDGLKGPFGTLKKYVQDRLLGGVSEEVQTLADRWLPHLYGTLGPLAGKLNAVADGLFAAFGRQQFIDDTKAAVGGFGDMLARIGKSLPGFFDAFGRLGRASVPVVKFLGDLIGGILDRFSNWIKKADDAGKLDQFFKDAAASLKQIFHITGLVFRIFGKLVEIFYPQSKKASDSILGGVEDFLTGILVWLSDPKNQQSIRDWVAKVGTFVTGVGVWLTRLAGWVEALGRWMGRVKTWGLMVGAVLRIAASGLMSAWRFIRDKVFEPFRRFISVTIPGAFTSAKAWVVGKFSEVRDRLSGVWSWIRDKVFIPLKNAITQTVPNAFRSGVDAVKRMWDRLVGIAKTPVKFVVGTILNSGLIAGYNKIAGVFPGAPKIDPIKLPKGFATGGVLPGYSPGRDVHRFVSPTGGVLDLSGGEPVMRPEFGRAVGTGWVDTMNRAARTGGVSGVRKALGGQYARGGVIGSADGLGELWKRAKGKASDIIRGTKAVLTDPAGSLSRLVDKLGAVMPGKDSPFGKLALGVPKKALSLLVERVRGYTPNPGSAGTTGPGNGASPFGGSAGMMRALRGVFPGLRLISGFRPGSTTLSGNSSYHSRDRAVDLPPERSVAKYIFEKFRSITRELITPFPEYNLHNGRPHRYTGAIWQQHNFAGGNAHDHWAARLGGTFPIRRFDKGGAWPNNTLGVNTSGRTEFVDPQYQQGRNSGGGDTYVFDLTGAIVSSKKEFETMVVGAIKDAKRSRRLA